MSVVRSEVTLKFSELPQVAVSRDNKKVKAVIRDQNGNTFTILLNIKSWRKAEANAESFNEWAGVISGKMGQRMADGSFEVLDAGVQLFEKKKSKVETLQP